MVQEELFQVDAKLKAAIGVDIELAGGNKAAGVILWADKDPEIARGLASNASNPKQKQKLTYDQIQDLKTAARQRSGRSAIHEYESKLLLCDVHWVSVQEETQRVGVTLTNAMHGLNSAMQEANELLLKLSGLAK